MTGTAWGDIFFLFFGRLALGALRDLGFLPFENFLELLDDLFFHFFNDLVHHVCNTFLGIGKHLNILA